MRPINLNKLGISITMVLVMILALPLLSEPVSGDWGYPGVEDLAWEQEESVHFQYRFEVHTMDPSDGSIQNIYSSPANFEFFDDGKTMVISERHLPSCTGWYPPITLETHIIEVETNRTIKTFENLSGFSISPDGSQIIVKKGTNISTYDLSIMVRDSFQDTGSDHRLFPEHVSWNQENDLIAIDEGIEVSIRERDTLNEIKRIPTRYEFGFSPDGSFFHVREELGDREHPLTVWNTTTWEKVFQLKEAMTLDYPWGPGFFYYRSNRYRDYPDENRTYTFISTDDWTEITSFDLEERTVPTITWNRDHTLFAVVEGGRLNGNWEIQVHSFPSMVLIDKLDYTYPPSSMCFSPDNSKLVFGRGNSNSGPYIEIMEIDDYEGGLFNGTPFGIVTPLILLISITIVIRGCISGNNRKR